MSNQCKKCGGKPKKGCFYCKECSPGMAPRRKEWGESNSPTVIKRLLIEDSGYVCSSCKHSEWLGKQIPLEADHIDGNSNNNDKSNLRLLCPNCHAVTPTYKSKNKNSGRHFRRVRYKEGKSF